MISRKLEVGWVGGYTERGGYVLMLRNPSPIAGERNRLVSEFQLPVWTRKQPTNQEMELFFFYNKLKCKVEMCVKMRWDVMQLKNKSNLNFQHLNKPY